MRLLSWLFSQPLPFSLANDLRCFFLNKQGRCNDWMDYIKSFNKIQGRAERSGNRETFLEYPTPSLLSPSFSPHTQLHSTPP